MNSGSFTYLSSVNFKYFYASITNHFPSRHMLFFKHMETVNMAAKICKLFQILALKTF